MASSPVASPLGVTVNRGEGGGGGGLLERDHKDLGGNREPLQVPKKALCSLSLLVCQPAMLVIFSF